MTRQVPDPDKPARTAARRQLKDNDLIDDGR